MTKSWWSGEPGENLLTSAIRDEDGLSLSDDSNESNNSRVTWWIVLGVVVLIAAFIGAGAWLILKAVNDCKDATAGCQPVR